MNRTIFMSKIHGFMPVEDARQVELAYLLAKKLHKGQTRKELGPDGQPLRYFEHLRRVALILIDEAGITDPSIIIAALLHDAIEDSEEIMLTGLLIERLFGSDVALLVRLVTKVPKEGYIERLRDGLKGSYGRPAVIKAADRLDNLRSLPKDNPAFCEKQRLETRDVMMPLFNSAETHLPPALMVGFRKIVSQIRSFV